MKIPKARRLPSGSWFIRVQVDGTSYSITRPTEKECMAEATAIKAGIKKGRGKRQAKTVAAAIDDYINCRKGIRSPSTIRGYKAIQKNRFQQMMRKNIYEVTSTQWQKAVDMESSLCSTKTLTNAWRFLSSVIHETTGNWMEVRLPQLIPNKRPWLTPEQIPVFLEAVKGTSVEIPALLALCSLRRSEILDLRWNDINFKKGYVRVNGAAVYDENSKLIHKPQTKNISSRRNVPMIPQLIQALNTAEHKGEYVVTLKPSGIFAHINRICESNDLPQVGFHGLRHSFASLACHVGMTEDVAMRIGGWSDIGTMKKIYTHVSQEDIAAQSGLYLDFFKSCNKNDNENPIVLEPQ